jgi:hypothetical protein
MLESKEKMWSLDEINSLKNKKIFNFYFGIAFPSGSDQSPLAWQTTSTNFSPLFSRNPSLQTLANCEDPGSRKVEICCRNYCLIKLL